MARSGFTEDVNAFILGFEKGTEKTMRIVAGKTFSNIVFGSPVREGRFRGAWIATGAKPSSRTGKADKSGTNTANAATDVVMGLKDWSVFTLSNNLPYALAIEYGLYPDPVKNGTRINKSGTHKNPIKPIYEKRSKSGYSKQAPNGVVRVNIARANRELILQARKNLPK